MARQMGRPIQYARPQRRDSRPEVEASKPRQWPLAPCVRDSLSSIVPGMLAASAASPCACRARIARHVDRRTIRSSLGELVGVAVTALANSLKLASKSVAMRPAMRPISCRVSSARIYRPDRAAASARAFAFASPSAVNRSPLILSSIGSSSGRGGPLAAPGAYAAMAGVGAWTRLSSLATGIAEE